MKEQFDKYFAGTLTDTEKLNLFREIEQDAVLKDDMADMQNVMALSGLMDKEGDHILVTEKIKELERRTNKRKVLRISRSGGEVCGCDSLAFLNLGSSRRKTHWINIGMKRSG